MSNRIVCKPIKALLWTDENVSLAGSVEMVVYDDKTNALHTMTFRIETVDEFVFAMQNKRKVVLAELYTGEEGEIPGVYFITDETPTEEDISHF